jgi:hypothetical protein
LYLFLDELEMFLNELRTLSKHDEFFSLYIENNIKKNILAVRGVAKYNPYRI